LWRFGGRNVRMCELILQPGLALGRGVGEVGAPVASNNQIAKILDRLSCFKDSFVKTLAGGTRRRKRH
jgi:hypothetical protein